jgi:hypothetical protein
MVPKHGGWRSQMPDVYKCPWASVSGAGGTPCSLCAGAAGGSQDSVMLFCKVSKSKRFQPVGHTVSVCYSTLL